MDGQSAAGAAVAASAAVGAAFSFFTCIAKRPYQPPAIWVPKASGGKFASINAATAGAREELKLPKGEHDLQLYSLGTPNGVKVTVLLEELVDIDPAFEYDAWLAKIDGPQFGSDFVRKAPLFLRRRYSCLALMPCGAHAGCHQSKLEDPSSLRSLQLATNPRVRILCPSCRRLFGPLFTIENITSPHFTILTSLRRVPARFESGSILLYLCEKHDTAGVFLPKDPAKRAEVVNWLVRTNAQP
jgi:hypothetical protein